MLENVELAGTVSLPAPLLLSCLLRFLRLLPCVLPFHLLEALLFLIGFGNDGERESKEERGSEHDKETVDTSRLGEIRQAPVLECSHEIESHNAETDDAEGGQYYPHGDSSCESEENHDERECAAAPEQSSANHGLACGFRNTRWRQSRCAGWYALLLLNSWSHRRW